MAFTNYGKQSKHGKMPGKREKRHEEVLETRNAPAQLGSGEETALRRKWFSNYKVGG